MIPGNVAEIFVYSDGEKAGVGEYIITSSIVKIHSTNGSYVGEVGRQNAVITHTVVPTAETRKKQGTPCPAFRNREGKTYDCKHKNAGEHPGPHESPEGVQWYGPNIDEKRI